MKRRSCCLLMAVLLGYAACALAAEPTVYYFPYLAGDAPEAVMEFITMETYPLQGETVTSDFYAYPYAGGAGADLGLVYADGSSAHAYGGQLGVENLYGYRIEFADLPREDVIAVKSFESGVQWPEQALGRVSAVHLVAGERFYLMMEILRDGGHFPYSRTEADCTGLKLGESIVLDATFDLEEFQGETFPITVTKMVWLRGPVEIEEAEGEPEPDAEIIEDAEVPLSWPEMDMPGTVTQVPSATLALTLPTATPVPVPMATLPPVSSLPANEYRVLGAIEITNENSVNLRAEPTADSARVRTAMPGDRFECVGIAPNGWYAVLLSGGQTAYVSPKMVSFSMYE